MTGKGELNIKDEVQAARTARPRTHKGKLDTLPPHLLLNLLRELAVGTPGSVLAEQYGVTHQAISAFKQRRAQEIAAQREDLANAFGAMWIAAKENRIMAYEAEYERLNNTSHADHHLWSLARQAALKNVAEELGQLPPKASVTVNAVTHTIVGVDVDEALS